MVRTSEKFCHLYYRWQEIEILQLPNCKRRKNYRYDRKFVVEKGGAG